MGKLIKGFLGVVAALVIAGLLYRLVTISASLQEVRDALDHNRVVADELRAEVAAARQDTLVIKRLLDSVRVLGGHTTTIITNPPPPIAPTDTAAKICFALRAFTDWQDSLAVAAGLERDGWRYLTDSLQRGIAQRDRLITHYIAALDTANSTTSQALHVRQPWFRPYLAASLVPGGLEPEAGVRVAPLPFAFIEPAVRLGTQGRGLQWAVRIQVMKP